jgi:hypothetical protein
MPISNFNQVRFTRFFVMWFRSNQNRNRQCRSVSDCPASSNDRALTTIVQRGAHNIEHQFQYPTAHGFVFHDSCGFEAGSDDELKKVKEFIKKRAERDQLKDQLHVIWCAEALRCCANF